MENSQLKFVFERVIRNIAHEVRNPLTVIRGHSQIQRTKENINEDFLDLIEGQCSRIEASLASLYEAFHSQPSVWTSFIPARLVYEEISKVPFPVHVDISDTAVDAAAISFQRVLSLLISGVDVMNNPSLQIEITGDFSKGADFVFRYSSIRYITDPELLCYPFGAKHTFSEASSLFSVFMIAINENWTFSCDAPGEEELRVSISLFPADTSE